MEALLSQKNLYWAFPLKTSLQVEIHQIAQVLHSDRISTSELTRVRKRFIEALSQSIDAGFDFYYGKPTSQQGNLRPLVKRAVDSIINTVRYAIHLVVQRLFKSMPLNELILMSYYLDSMIIAGNKDYAYLAFPLAEHIRLELLNLSRKIAHTHAMADYSAELERVFSHIVRESTHYYYHAPTDLLQLNRIAKKAADLGIDSAVKGIEKILQRVVKDVAHERVALLFANLHYLVLSAEPGYPVASPHFVAERQQSG